ncbi:5-formyltetrahydrofolate cyclo-ligase [Persicitalea sp.]|uniref:5-formyltetrahydrofolate cyclo-ligase n=1 Tax=Persicitalea sp. TaxID=3100273 RepID=UPI0035935B6F
MKKKETRELFLKKRAAAEPADKDRIAAQLGEILSENPKINLLHSFIADPERNEVDTLFIRQILQEKRPMLQWAAPRMIPGTRRMENYVWNDETTLLYNRWGIEEPNPETSQFIKVQSIDAVLVPLLAFDRQGHRVGYGGGYYDRFLTQCRPDTLKIGLSYFDPINEIEDVDDWDVKLDICVTPDLMYRWGR